MHGDVKATNVMLAGRTQDGRKICPYDNRCSYVSATLIDLGVAQCCDEVHEHHACFDRLPITFVQPEPNRRDVSKYIAVLFVFFRRGAW